MSYTLHDLEVMRDLSWHSRGYPDGWPRSHEVVDGYETVDVAPREDS
jgi:hypothetical protein